MTTDCKTCALSIFWRTPTGKIKRGVSGRCTYQPEPPKHCHSITVQLNRIHIWPGVHETPCEAHEAIK